MYYLYKHIREDKQEVFYIGIGTIDTTYSTFKSHHKRAFEKNKSRSKHWKNIINKTTYKVQIICYSNSINDIIEKEIEFIALYKDTVCNQTLGGKGITSYKHTAKARKSISNTMLGRKLSESHYNNINRRKYKPIRMFNGKISINFDSLQEAGKYLNDPKCVANISRYLKYKKAKVKGYMFEEIIEHKDKELYG